MPVGDVFPQSMFSWRVTLEEGGRDGYVRYREPAGEIVSYWEFSGGSTVASVNIGTYAEWQERYPWALARRAEIVDRIGREVVRQRAPSCVVRLDEMAGWLHLELPSASLRSSPRVPPPVPSPIEIVGDRRGTEVVRAAAAVSFVHSLARVKRRFAVGVGVIALVVGFAAWVGQSALSIRTTGSRFGDSTRSGNTIATLIHRLQPYIPSLHRDVSKNRYELGVLLHAADGSRAPTYVRIERGLTAQAGSHAKFIGVDPKHIWFRGSETGAIDLATWKLLDADELAAVAASEPTPTGRLEDLATGDRAREWLIASGGLITPERFIAALGDDDARSDLRDGSSVRATIDRDGPAVLLPLWVADVVTIDGRQQVRGARKIPSAQPTYYTRFVRGSRGGPLLRLAGTSHLLRYHYTKEYRSSNVFVSRIDEQGSAVWEADLGIRQLEEILPDPDYPAFIGIRPPPNDNLAKPVLVIVNARTGATSMHELVVE